MAGKQYVVVGGSHGIGLGIVKRLISKGDQVLVISRTCDQLAGLDGVLHLPVDVTTDEIAASQLPASIDGLAYCPGSINLGPFRGLKPAAMLDDFQLNVVGGVKCLQAALVGLKAAEKSSIVFFSTVAVAQGLPMHSSIAASKGAVEALTRTLAVELAPKIRVNCIAPALTDTPLAAKFLGNDEKRNAMADRYPLKRIGTVDDIAAAAEFLLGDQSGWMTGQVMGVDGGMSTLRN
ncbi:SDR family NAD(P)-dependent oxidoreductase [Rubripirellula reticaptiva]|uniref:2-(S)-hydroxypropyl-CoM dehydrogenase n=1 Tax=Rubripirellula reticaptiva TaxID=2528013 RepID=A0A5C6F8C2_9BACT|nr:SDR family oxidoreductase [Rubripirellula reticaptiva]TWU57648.1 2-(S)-hydroxypropyl-CoM dehydrogenase [Rubripirellula reticaptiva]